MGKKRPKAGEADENPRKAKNPRLDLLALAAEVADSAGGEAAAPEVSNLREEGAEGTGGNNLCNHVPTDSAHKEMLSVSLLSKDGGACLGCQREEGSGKLRPEKSSILMCLECGRHFCSGVGGADYPLGHSRHHAMQKQHWVAALYGDPEKGYCFKCNAEVEMTVEFEVDDHVIGLHVVRDLIGGLPNLGEQQQSHEFGSANGQGYAIRGIPNIANTCYLNAVVQCLLALDKLRARMLGPDAPKGLFAITLTELFVETSAAGGMLNPEKLLTCVRWHNKMFEGYCMHDSHELLCSLRDGLNEEEEKYKNQSGAPTFIKSIFGFELSETRSCKCGLSNSVSHAFFYDLSLSLTSKEHPAKSAASPQISESLKSQPKKIKIQLFPANEQRNLEKMQTVAESSDSHLLDSELKDVVVEETPKPFEVDSTEAQHICQSKGAVQGSLQIQEDKVSCFELPRRIIEVPVTSVNFLPHNASDIEVEEINEMTADSIASLEDCLSLFFENVIQWRCDNCSKVHEEPNANQSKNVEQTVASTNENTTVDGDQTEQSDRKTCQNEQSSGRNSLSVECKSSSSRQPHGSDAESQIIRTVDTNTDEKESAACSITNKDLECHEGTLEAESSCLPAEKQTNLLRAQHGEDLSKQFKMYQDRRKQFNLDHSAYRLKDEKKEQHNGNGDAIQRSLFKKLPPVLTLHLKRTISGSIQVKNSEHVRFKEYLDVGRFVDPSSEDKDNSIYRLAGVIEHRGTGSLNTGHYVAYVRARRLGNHQQQSSCSSSWFCADDSNINEVTLAEVLKREAYVLFYERMEG